MKYDENSVSQQWLIFTEELPQAFQHPRPYCKIPVEHNFFTGDFPEDVMVAPSLGTPLSVRLKGKEVPRRM